MNLRPPWWQLAQLENMLQGAHWVKLNDDELDKLQAGCAPAPDKAREFVDRYGLQGLVVTHGAAGAEILLAGGERIGVETQPGVDVIDTVGAGDAFAAVMIVGLARDWSPALILKRAQQFAAAIVGRRGATVADRGFYREFLEEWGLAAPPAVT